MKRADRLRGRLWRVLRAVRIRERRLQHDCARQLHDDAGQLVAMVTSRLSTAMTSHRGSVPATELASILELSQAASLSISEIISTLSQPPQPAGRFERYIRRAAIAAAERHQLDVRCLIARKLPPIDQQWHEHVIGFVRQAVTNAGRDRRGRQVSVLVRAVRGELAIAVEDDGPLKAARASASLSGLAGLRSIADALLARLEIASTPGIGTRVELRMPLAGSDRRQPPGERGAA